MSGVYILFYLHLNFPSVCSASNRQEAQLLGPWKSYEQTADPKVVAHFCCMALVDVAKWLTCTLVEKRLPSKSFRLSTKSLQSFWPIGSLVAALLKVRLMSWPSETDATSSVPARLLLVDMIYSYVQLAACWTLDLNR